MPIVKKKGFRPKIRSRHPSHNILRQKDIMERTPFKSVIRLGSTTELPDTIEKGGNRVELNTTKAIRNSSNKLLMKQCFTDAGVNTADWWIWENSTKFKNQMDQSVQNINELPYPIISKSHFGSRNKGNKKHDTKESLATWLKNHNANNYIFEKFYNYAREYRFHVHEGGFFYTCRKMLKQDTPEKDKWFRNDAHCVWIMKDNPLYDAPINLKEIEKQGIKALKSVGLDFGALDIKIQSATNIDGQIRQKPNFIIIEINSAPSFGEYTAKKYCETLPIILKNKYNKET
jgi:glutathione synthase/RimK-type ligase-like ATP-grasp enzyme